MALTGKDGKVQVGANTVAELDEWELEFGPELLDSASFLDEWEEKTAALKSWSGSASGRLDPSDALGQGALEQAALDGSDVTLNLYVDATRFHTGPAKVARVSPKASVSGLVEVEFSFEGNGALTPPV